MNCTSDTPHYENVPIEVPASWSIIPLEYLATFSGGKTPSMDNKEYWNNGKHLWVTSKDMKSVHITDSLMKISDSALEQMNIYPKGTLLLVTRSGILRHTLPIAILGDEATVNQDIKTISCHFSNINRYLYYAIKAQEQVILEQYHKDGTTVDSIDFDKFKKLPIPLPPIEEQSRIIAEINRLFALVDTIENNQTDLESTIAQTKSKILDLAIHGKLVPQDPNDEPASELLKRINPAAEITCDNGQYGKIPDNWCITRIKNAFLINPRNKEEDANNAGFVPMANICDGYFNRFTYETKKWVEIKTGFTHFADGDIAVAKISPCLENRKSMVLNNLPNGIGAGTTELHVFRPLCVTQSYGLWFFKSEYFVNQCVSTFNGVVGQQRVGKNIVEDILFPLPPLAEQHRIVAKIEELFSYLDNIQKSLEV